MRERGVVRLRSAVYDEVWEPHRSLGATCRSAGQHDVPALGCTCGLYGTREPAAALRYLVGRDDPDVVHRVLGLVALWGTVAEGPSGWRASHAYPLRLWLPPARTNGELVATADVAIALQPYGVPVHELREFEPARIVRELQAVDDPERTRRLRAA